MSAEPAPSESLGLCSNATLSGSPCLTSPFTMQTSPRPHTPHSPPPHPTNSLSHFSLFFFTALNAVWQIVYSPYVFHLLSVSLPRRKAPRGLGFLLSALCMVPGTQKILNANLLWLSEFVIHRVSCCGGRDLNKWESRKKKPNSSPGKACIIKAYWKTINIRATEISLHDKLHRKEKVIISTSLEIYGLHLWVLLPVHYLLGTGQKWAGSIGEQWNLESEHTPWATLERGRRSCKREVLWTWAHSPVSVRSTQAGWWQRAALDRQVAECRQEAGAPCWLTPLCFPCTAWENTHGTADRTALPRGLHDPGQGSYHLCTSVFSIWKGRLLLSAISSSQDGCQDKMRQIHVNIPHTQKLFWLLLSWVKMGSV